MAGGTVTAEGDLDFRGTLAVSKDAPVGFRSIRLTFDLDTEASAEQVQTLAHPAQLSVSAASSAHSVDGPGLLPGAGGGSVAVQHLGPVGVPGGGGPVFVQHQRPAPPVDHDLVMVLHKSTHSVRLVAPP